MPRSPACPSLSDAAHPASLRRPCPAATDIREARAAVDVPYALTQCNSGFMRRPSEKAMSSRSRNPADKGAPPVGLVSFWPFGALRSLAAWLQLGCT